MNGWSWQWSHFIAKAGREREGKELKTREAVNRIFALPSSLSSQLSLRQVITRNVSSQFVWGERESSPEKGKWSRKKVTKWRRDWNNNWTEVWKGTRNSDIVSSILPTVMAYNMSMYRLSHFLWLQLFPPHFRYTFFFHPFFSFVRVNLCFPNLWYCETQHFVPYFITFQRDKAI